MDANNWVNILAFAIFTLLWLAFAYALLLDRALLERSWQRFRGWPVLVQIIVALLFLPLVLGLWAWHMRWPAWLRVLLIIGLAWFTEYSFYPFRAAIR